MTEAIMTHLPAEHPWRGSIYCFDTIDSTNTYAKTLATSGAPQGTVVIANAQTGGRGRLGRSFSSPPGFGIYMSVILRPHCPPTELMHLTCAAAVAACDAIEEAAGFRPGIKWINDLVAERKKLAGILTELSIDPKTGLTDYAVLGIGINCTQQPEDFPPELRQIACSAAMITGKVIDRSYLAAALICHFQHMSRELLTRKTAILDIYRRDCVTLGRQITVIRGDSCRHAEALAVCDDGALLVRFPDGHTETVDSGEVSVRGLFGYH